MSPSAAMWSPLLFGFALFLNSALLFIVQPMLGKTLLPHLGGNAVAWNACLVFFQAALLAGYVYADLLHRFRGLLWQPCLQLLLMAIATILCFVGLLGDGLLVDLAPRLTSIEDAPILSTLCLLIVVIGLPFLTLAAIGPLVQRWFSHLDHPKSSDPYFLFVASNLGALMGLIVYTLMIEPNSPLYAQWMSWKLAVTALGVVLLLTAFCAWRSPRSVELEPPEKPSDPNAPLIPRLIGCGPATWGRCLYWGFASALPVGLMMALTNHLTLDIAPGVILWAVPLALYLVAFSVEFARFSPLNYGSFGLKLAMHILFGVAFFGVLVFIAVELLRPRERGLNELEELTFLCVLFVPLMLIVPFIWLPVLQPLSALAVVFAHANMFIPDPLMLTSPAILLHLACFYWSARLCLGMLAKDRPAAPSLTTYTIWIGSGGLAGGLFTLIVAPWLFRSGYREYAFLTAIACTLRPAWLPHGFSDWILSSLLFGKPKNDPATSSPWPRRLAVGFDFGLAFLVALAALGLFFLRTGAPPNVGGPGRNVFVEDLLVRLNDFPLVIALMLTAVLFMRPLRFGLALTAIVAFCFIGLDAHEKSKLIARDRNAFGIFRVTEATNHFPIMPEPFLRAYTQRSLVQGNVLQGTCITEPAELLRHPTTYYHRKGPVGQVMRRLEWWGYDPNLANLPGNQNADFWMRQNPDNAKGDARIAVSLIGMTGPLEQLVAAWSEPPFAFVGLGTGTLFTYARPYQWVDAYELDPAIIALSTQQPPVFHYFQSAQNRGVNGKIFPGDARRSLARSERDGFYHVLFVDAFNSNAIPVHLLTQEAIELYFQKLAPEGVVCFHTSNRHLDLVMVLERIRQHLNLSIREVHEKQNNDDRHQLAIASLSSSQWVVLARNEQVMEKWSNAAGVFRNDAPQGMKGNRFALNPLWTDEHASVLSAFRSGRGAEQGWPRLIYGLLILLLLFGILLGLIEIAYSMIAPPAVKPTAPTRK